MSTVDTEARVDVPQSVTFREVQEIIRTFQRSDWSAMTLELRGLRITLGKDGPPAASTTQPAALASAPAVPAPHAVPVSPAALPAPAAQPAPAATAAAPATTAPPGGGLDTTGCVAVRSPAVGAFWTAPSPSQPPFVQVGHVVDRDEQLAIVEVMKLMNPVVAAVAGELVEVCAQNAQMVEYDQLLFWIRPSDG